jgi:hypothetical protein
MKPSPPPGSRSLRVVNILLSLCFFLMLARLYQKYTASALEGVPGLPRAVPPRAGGVPGGASSSLPSAAASLDTVDLDGLPRMWKQRSYFPSKAIAATGAAAGPAALAPLRGRCFYFVVPDRTVKIEWCPEDHVQQVRMPVYGSTDSGWYAGWKKEGAKFLHQLYEGGEQCGPGFDFPRSTQVHLTCKPDAQGTLYSEMSRGVDLVEFKEVDVCKYSLTLGLKEWCEVEREQGAL